mgnify:CR=1 FL=1
MQTQDFLNNLWRWKVGEEETSSLPPKDVVTYEELRKTEWSVDFERLMRNRLILGAYRYGRIDHANNSNKPHYDRTASIIKRMELYEQTGNKELLVDVANLCLLEFVECKHPKANFTSIDDGEHVKHKKR